MMYVEFIERDRAMPIEIFRQLGNQGSAWGGGDGDRVVLQLGRTLRFGPRPAWLCFWEIPGVARLDAWEDYFESPAAKENPRSLAMHRAINIDRAGLYDVPHAAPVAPARLYVIEHLDGGEMPARDVAARLAERAAGLPQARLVYVLCRVGRLGPDPPSLAVWAAGSYVDAEPLLRSPPPRGISLLDLGVYKEFGRETL